MKFKIKVFHNLTGVLLLRVSAANMADAVDQAQRRGYQVISVIQNWGAIPLRSPTAFSAALFSQELLVLMEAGLSLVESVDILFRKARERETQRVLESLLRQLREGVPFSKALENLPEAFPVLYVATIRTSERTGDLTGALRRFLAYHRQLKQVSEKVVAASVYPALLMGVGLLVVLFLLGYVVPRFSLVYEDLGKNLPWMSQVLMSWGKFIDHYGWQILLVTFVAISGLVYLLTRAHIRARFMLVLWSVPTLGEKMRLYQLARFTRTLAMLINGGIPFVTALDMVRDLLRQPALRLGLSRAADSVREGQSISHAFAANALATEVGVRLLAVGENSGELGLTMERIATLYDEELSRWIDWFTKLFEPVLMIGIGLVIGVIVVLMYLPIFELANSLQ